MTSVVPSGAQSPFEHLKQADPERGDIWSARDLQAPMGYDRWERFESAIERAIAAAENSGADPKDHFRGAAKKVDIGSSAVRTVTDWHLSRYAAYLVAMNGDPRKPEIAAAQTYFAVKTREAELTTVALPQDYEEALVALLGEVRERKALEGKVAELEPMAAQAAHYRSADGLIAVGDFANDIKGYAKRELNLRVLHPQVWEFLGEIGLIIRGNTVRHNEPTAFATDNDYVRAKKTEFETNTRGLQSSSSPRLTPAGAGFAWDRAVHRLMEHQGLRKDDGRGQLDIIQGGAA